MVGLVIPTRPTATSATDQSGSTVPDDIDEALRRLRRVIAKT
jgi:hypothetical protein